MTQRPLRLLQILVGEPHGGAERFFERLAIALAEYGVDQRIAILRDETRAAILREAGLTVEQFDFARWPRGIAENRRLQAYADAFQPHIALAFMNRAARRMPRGPFTKIGRVGGYYKARFYRRCDWVIAITPDLMRHMEEDGWPKERLELIPLFGELPPAEPIARAEFGTPDDAVLALAMGRHHPSKGYDLLIDAAARLPDLHVWIAGEGEVRPNLEAQVARLGLGDRVKFLGWREDRAALLQACDISVLPSRHEPLSNVTVETWSSARAYVAAAAEGPSWQVEHGVNGWLCDLGSVDSLTEGLRAVAGDAALRERLAKGGHETWRREYSKDAIVRRYLDFFERVRPS